MYFMKIRFKPPEGHALECYSGLEGDLLDTNGQNCSIKLYDPDEGIKGGIIIFTSREFLEAANV